jgi:Tfp pilus assembly protein FimT
VTLLESTVVAGIAAVLMGVVVPSMQATLHRQAIVAEATQFREGCTGPGPRRCAAARWWCCARWTPGRMRRDGRVAPSGKDWSQGWLVFLDRNGSGDCDDDDPVLIVHQHRAPAGSVTATLRSISFHPLGFSTNAASHFRYVPPGEPPDSRGARQPAGLRQQAGPGAADRGGRLRLKAGAPPVRRRSSGIGGRLSGRSAQSGNTAATFGHVCPRYLSPRAPAAVHRNAGSRWSS